MSFQNKSLTKNLLYIYTALITGTILIVNFINPSWVYRYTWLIVLFFFLLTIGSISATKYAARHWRKQFIQVYFGIMTLRLFISVAFALMLIVLDREHVLVFGINFLVLYLLFLGFEIYSILTNLRTHFKKGIGND